MRVTWIPETTGVEIVCRCGIRFQFLVAAWIAMMILPSSVLLACVAAGLLSVSGADLIPLAALLGALPIVGVMWPLIDRLLARGEDEFLLGFVARTIRATPRQGSRS
jgi:hypothetical protein